MTCELCPLGMLNWLYTWYDCRGRLTVREVAEQFSAPEEPWIRMRLLM